MNTVFSLNCFLKGKTNNLKLFQQNVGEDRNCSKNFVDKMKSFCPKRRLPEDYFESDLKAFLPPVNEGIDEVASALSESLRAIFVN